MTLGAIDPQHHGYFYHYYRAEVYRETNWRNRLDVTTNWSIVVTAAMLSYVFGNEHSPHAVIIMNYLTVLFFLYIESRRFRYYTMLKSRTRILEAGLLVPIIDSVHHRKTDNSEPLLNALARNLEKPTLTISRLEAIGWRMRRVYIFLLTFLYIVWMNKLAISPVRSYDVLEIVSRGSVWFVPGWIVVMVFTFSVLAFLFIAVYMPLRSVGDDLP